MASVSSQDELYPEVEEYEEEDELISKTLGKPSCSNFFANVDASDSEFEIETENYKRKKEPKKKANTKRRKDKIQRVHENEPNGKDDQVSSDVNIFQSSKPPDATASKVINMTNDEIGKVLPNEFQNIKFRF